MLAKIQLVNSIYILATKTENIRKKKWFMCIFFYIYFLNEELDINTQ